MNSIYIDPNARALKSVFFSRFNRFNLHCDFDLIEKKDLNEFRNIIKRMNISKQDSKHSFEGGKTLKLNDFKIYLRFNWYSCNELNNYLTLSFQLKFFRNPLKNIRERFRRKFPRLNEGVHGKLTCNCVLSIIFKLHRLKQTISKDKQPNAPISLPTKVRLAKSDPQQLHVSEGIKKCETYQYFKIFEAACNNLHFYTTNKK